MRILVVEDEVELAGAIAATLRGEGFGTDVAHSVEDARFHADVHPYDAIVLDRRLPDGEGLELCREWRAAGVSTPVLMLTALDDSSNIVEGLEGGADDYLTKPFATEVLVARLRSLIRRGPVLRKSVIEAGGVEIDPARRRVKQAGVVVPLTAKEFALLEFLAHRAGEVVDRFDILEHCWDHAYEPESNVVDVHVRGLRRKLGDGVVETVRGAGYRVPETAADTASAAAPGQVPTGTVTVVFTDIVDSTATTERVGDRRWLELLAEHNALVRAHLAEHGGYEVKSTGDGFMLAFGSARSALDCAIGIQRGLATRREEHPGEPLAVRIGLHTGEPIWGESDFHGRGVALAARIGAKAEADEILCSTLTRELTESLGDFTFEGHRDVKLKGLSGRHRVHVVSSPELRRLRLRLTLSYAVASLLALAALGILAISIADKREHEELDNRVKYGTVVSQAYVYGPDKLTIDRAQGGPFEPGRRLDPPVVVVSPQGKPLAGSADILDPAAAKRAYRRAKQPEITEILYSDTVKGEQARLASYAVTGDKGILAAVVAVEPVASADDAVRNFAVAVIGATLGLWLVTIGLGWLLAGRALRPAVATARREEAFLADAAHELRTPVAVIRARAEQGLRESGESSPDAGALRAIAGAAEQATNTIADMLELARLDARRSRIEREPLRLDALVEQVAEEFEDDAAKAGVDIRTEVEAALVVEGDERLLARAIANLVQNGIRYGGVGGEVNLAVRREGDQALVEVTDRGPGVPPAQRKAIFDRFHRASSEAGGSGLGLPIARLVAESHDGSLELLPAVEGQPGAHFILRLPISGE